MNDPKKLENFSRFRANSVGLSGSLWPGMEKKSQISAKFPVVLQDSFSCNYRNLVLAYKGADFPVIFF